MLVTGSVVLDATLDFIGALLFFDFCREMSSQVLVELAVEVIYGQESAQLIPDNGYTGHMCSELDITHPRKL